MWTVGSLAGAVLLAAVAGRAWAQGQANVVKPVAVVNGEPIAFAEVDALLRAGGGPSAVEVPESRRRQMRLDALAILMDRLLLQQFLRKMGTQVDPAEVKKFLTDLENGLKKDNKKVADYLAENSMSEAQLRLRIVNELQWRNYAKSRVSDADVLRYYTDNKDFFDGVSIRASHIVFRVSPNSSEGEVQAAKAKLTALRQDIVAGKIDFAEAAKKFSQCPSAPEGGDIGYFPRKWVVDEEFAKAAYDPRLKVGDITEAIRTDYGVHLIKITDRKPGQPSDFNKIKDDVRELCMTELQQNVIAQQRKQAKIEVNLP
jgi:peptidyl-prolyl cis-trans isomerase C